MNRTTSVAWLGLVLIAAGVIPALWAAGELMGGILEIPHHWWSGLAMVPLLIGVAITAFGLVRIRVARADDRIGGSGRSRLS